MRLSVFTLLFSLVAAFHTVIPTQAEAASALFRMKRSWWGPNPQTTQTTIPNSYISPTYHPNTKGPNKAPPAACGLFIDTVPLPECGPIPSKVIELNTGTRSCFPFGCPLGHHSTTYPSYWNVEGRFRPSNPYAATTTTTVLFPTTMGNPSPPFATGEPTSPTTTFSGRYDFLREGSIVIVPGPRRFGGTMKYFYGPNHLITKTITVSSPYVSRGTWVGGQTSPLLIHASQIQVGVIGRRITLYRYTLSGYDKVTTGTPYSPGAYYTKVYQNISTVAPWTTGFVFVAGQTGYSRADGSLSGSGYDARTPNGFAGVVSLIRPRLVHTYVVPNDPNLPIVKSRSFAQIWQLDIHFLPEPGGAVLLGAGLLTLVGLYRFRRR
jgi:hypothetical protein